MGYNYPQMQGHFYSIQELPQMGYKSPMKMTFKHALEHAMRVRSITSVRGVAVKAGVSPDILKNIMQEKSEKPNAAAAAKIADFFGASVQDFLAGAVSPDAEDAAVKRDAAAISDLVRRLHPEHRDQVEAFARALLRTEEAQIPSE